ncbi:TraC family protein [Geoalkalibacter halelectricus]|uniref:TraC family protein n=1 Tax=Geoalkalibacter halelectricus TaxID=2847045 RepID=UPI002670B7B9|nr:TraC family protein [Geoalkalibacter halelectricus]MDO3380352.1 TraC family protein [Geoalkalibacter halelectricus]
MGLAALIFGDEAGLRKRELAKATQRSKFSDFFPWVSYDPKDKTYYTTDGCVGLMWECTPMIFAGEKACSTMEGLFRVDFPEGSVLQFILYADPHIDPYLESHKALKVRGGDVFTKAAKSFTEFLQNGTTGLDNLMGIPVRNFRVFVTVKMPEAGIKNGAHLREIKTMANETLSGARLHPEHLEPPGLLAWLRRMFNDNPGLDPSVYDDRVPIGKQIINAETQIRKRFDHVHVGSKSWRCMTPKTFPRDVSPIQTNQLFGGIDGIASDPDQVPVPFLYCVNIIIEDQKKALHTKCNLILQQQGFGSFAPALARMKEEYSWATDEIERGRKFYRIVPVMWIMGRSDEESAKAISRARRMWESQGYGMQEDRGILPILMISSLPFGLYNHGQNVENMERDHVVQADAIPAVTPIQGDFSGMGKPVMVFVGRKGQLVSLDLMDKNAPNHNALVVGGSGGGKSFFANYLLGNHYSCGAKIRVIDLGGSYEKATKLYGARYLDFDGSTRICINPFSNIGVTSKKTEDIEKDISVVAPIAAQMAFSATNELPNETEMTLLRSAVRWAWENEGNQAGVDHIYHYLSESKWDNTEISMFARKLAFNLQEFTSKGVYGRYFNGPSTFDIAGDDFVVLELENLKPCAELFKVVTLQIINAVTNDLYLSDRSDPRLILFDEAWQFLRASGPIAEIMESGYRRARKYSGSFSVVFQSPLDLNKFGAVGDVIRGNSAFKFYLESEDYPKAHDMKLIDYDEFVMRILKSTRSRKPKYSEIFFHTPFGQGVGRLVVDNYTYYVNTSSGDEIAEIERMVDQGASYDQAIEEMVRRYRS